MTETTVEIEVTDVTEETETDGAHAHLITGREETTIKQTPTPPVETIERENVKSAMEDEEMNGNGTEIVARGVETMTDNLDETGICLMTGEEVAEVVKIELAEKIEMNSHNKQNKRSRETVLHPRSENPPQI